MPWSLASSSSTCRPSRSAIVGGTTLSGHHLLDIEGYSYTKELPTGECIKSIPFSAGGYSWRIYYYPNGNQAEDAEFVSLFVFLHQDATKPVKVRARAKFSLLDQDGQPVPSRTITTNLHDFAANSGHGYSQFVKRAFLESTCLKDDSFTVRCDVFVSKKVLHAEKRGSSSPAVAVPPSDLHHQLGDLLASKVEGAAADVTFQVAGETFRAHRCVLAARSPVFKAELFGAMNEGAGAAVVRVGDMEAKVFGALLGFIYTDRLPDVPEMPKLQEEVAMAQHLLVAADRYGLERLKLLCEEKLCGLMDTGSVTTILALAEQHNCRGLKEACVQFICSPSNLNVVVATDGFEHLTRSCPNVLKELVSSIAAQMDNEERKARLIDYCNLGLVLVVLCIVLSSKGGNAFLSCLCFIVASFATTYHVRKY